MWFTQLHLGEWSSEDITTTTATKCHEEEYGSGIRMLYRIHIVQIVF